MARERPAAPTLAQAIEEYLDWQALDRGRSPNTVRAYGIDLAGFRAFAGAAGIDELAGVDRDLLREFQAAMARGRRGGRPLSPQTRHRRLVALGSFLRFCAREEWFVVGLDARGTTSLDDLEVADQPLPPRGHPQGGRLPAAGRHATQPV